LLLFLTAFCWQGIPDFLLFPLFKFSPPPSHPLFFLFFAVLPFFFSRYSPFLKFAPSRRSSNFFPSETGRDFYQLERQSASLLLSSLETRSTPVARVTVFFFFYLLAGGLPPPFFYPDVKTQYYGRLPTASYFRIHRNYTPCVYPLFS